MNDIATVIADLARAGVDPDLIGRVAATFAANAAPELPVKSSAAERMARYRSRRRDLGMNPNFRGADHKDALLERDGPLCVYCQEVDGESVDHVVPISKGGTDHLDNLAMACMACNGGKSGRTPEEWGVEIASVSARAAHVRYVRERGEQPRTCSPIPKPSPSRVVYTTLPSEEVITPSPPKGGYSPRGTNPSSNRATRLPDDWEPEGDDWSVAMDLLGGDIPAVNELDKFRDYWRAVPGAKGRKQDWAATWRNWIRRTSESQPQSRKANDRNHHPPPDRNDKLRAMLAGAMAASDDAKHGL